MQRPKTPKGQTVASPTYRRHFETSEELCHYLADRTDTVFLSFSAGKDAVASWLQLRRYFRRIIPFHLELIPGIAFTEANVRYYEDFFGTKIWRYPHPSFFRMLRNFVFQSPERCAVIERLNLPRYEFDDVEWDLRRKLGLTDTFVAVGNRASDSMVRRTNIRQHGSLNPRRLHFLPIFDWTTSRLMDEIRGAKVKLSREYEMFGRSFDGVTNLWLRGVAEHCPEDYQRILAWFPLAYVEFARREIKPEPR